MFKNISEILYKKKSKDSIKQMHIVTVIPMKRIIGLAQPRKNEIQCYLESTEKRYARLNSSTKKKSWDLVRSGFLLFSKK